MTKEQTEERGMRKRKRKKVNTGKKNHGKRIAVTILAVFVGVTALSMAAFLLLKAKGKTNIQNETAGASPSMDTGEVTEEQKKAEEWPEGRISYKGQLYDYNSDIMTFLVMGIDSKDEKVKETEEARQGGQADTIFLLVLNPHNKRMQMIALDRNTMAEVDRYGEQDAYLDTIITQICVQHGFGDGTVKSAERMEKAVSKVFMDLPFTGYCAINMSAIPKINDFVGGVTLTVQQDLSKRSPNLVAGSTVTLTGKEAYEYIHYRDTGEFGTAAERLQRQKQYMVAYVKQAKEAFKKDPSLPVTVFNTLLDYMTTDVTLDEATYLASEAAGYSFDENSMLTVPGETKQGEIYEEFYPDEEALQQLIIDVFYEEVQN
ncbi:MAG: LCP family protein [Lachnospiraceae bacterium]|nr:LCP family protein [Lachnospiraceae bacterium]